MDDGVIVELGLPYSKIIQLLEMPDVEDQWSVTLSDLQTHLGIADEFQLVFDAVKFINAHVKSININYRYETDGECVFALEVMELDGALVPYGGEFNQTVIKTVREVHRVIEPIIVGDGLKRPSFNLKKKRVKGRNRVPLAFTDEEVIWATGFVPEAIKGFIEPPFYQSMKDMVAWGRHIALEGPPGIGKSSAVKQLASEVGQILVSVPGDAGFHKRDLTGTPRATKGSSVILAAEYVTAAVKGWWVRIDEVNSADADALMYINSQTEEPYKVQLFGRTYDVHQDFRLFITYNKGLTGTKMLPQATVDRFVLFKIAYPEQEFLTKLLFLKGAIDMREVLILSGVAKALWSEKIRYQLSPRRLFDAILYARSSDVKTSDIADFLHQSILPYVWAEPELDLIKNLIAQGVARGMLECDAYEIEQRELEFSVRSGDAIVSTEVIGRSLEEEQS